MNIAQAKAIPLSDLLARLGHVPARDRGGDTWFLSPFRQEKSPSFHIHADRNVWYDFGDGRGGNALDFMCAYLESRGLKSSVSDALDYLRVLMGNAAPPPQASPIRTPYRDTAKTLHVQRLGTIRDPALVRYLQERGISFETARQYLKEASVSNRKTGKHIYALAFANEEGGYELRNQYYKGAVSPKGISFVRGTMAKPDGIHVFEGMMDFLTVLTREKTSHLLYDAIILNSLSMLEQAFPYVKGYGYRKLFAWMDDDPAGEKATLALADFAESEDGLRLYPMDAIYAPHKDVNAWHMAELGLQALEP